MTLLTAVPDRVVGRPAAATARVGPPPTLLVACAALASLAISLPAVAPVLHGAFTDPDDAMRLVEVRAWIAGQPWFDVTALRLDPPTGASMHWSRLVDLPVAGFIALFRLAFAGTKAEALARIAVPTVLLVGFLAGVARLALVVLGEAGLALVAAVLSAGVLVQFQPGRIGHHAPETLTLVWAVAAAAASLDPAKARQAALAGGLVALALAMSLETLPFLAMLCACMVLAWVAAGDAMARTLRCFGLGLGAGLAVFFIATMAPERWGVPVCDSFGVAHLLACGIVAAGAIGLGFASPLLPLRAHRMAAAAALCGLALLAVAVVTPACLRSPFAEVDPLVREIWLDHVAESKSLPRFMQENPMLGLAVAAPVAIGLAGLLAASRVSVGVAALRFRLLAALVAVGLALAFAQVRVLGSVAPLALCGGVFAVGACKRRLVDRAGILKRLAAFAPALILPFTSTAWSLALPDDMSEGPRLRQRACLAPTAFAPLASLPRGRVVAPIDAGSFLLATTALGVFDAPYHRNNDGNRYAYDAMSAPPDLAHSMLAARQVDYVMTCDGLGDTNRLALHAPHGLAAALLAGEPPAWLERLPLAGTPYQVYRVGRSTR